MASSTAETAAKKLVKEHLHAWAEANSMKVQVEPRPQGQMSMGGVSDWVVTVVYAPPDDTTVRLGTSIYVEMKAKRNQPTKLQVLYLKGKYAHGIDGWVLWGDDEDQRFAFFMHLFTVAKELKSGARKSPPVIILTKQEALDYARSLRP